MKAAGAGQHIDLADRFLKDARDAGQPVSMYLVSGFQLKGEIVEFDEAAILFRHKGMHQLVMRPAVANMYRLPSSRGDADRWWKSLVSSAAEE